MDCFILMIYKVKNRKGNVIFFLSKWYLSCLTACCMHSKAVLNDNMQEQKGKLLKVQNAILEKKREGREGGKG